MKKTSAAKQSQVAKELRVNEQKWSKTLMDAGWTAFPSVIIERQKALGLDAMDLNILLHLASHWWTRDNKPHPSKKTIAAAMDVTPRTVQRRIATMQKDGLIRREERSPNRHSIDRRSSSAVACLPARGRCHPLETRKSQPF